MFINMTTPKKKGGRPPVRSGRNFEGRSGVTLHCRIDKPLSERLEAYVDRYNKSDKARTTKGAIVELALKRFLEQEEAATPKE